MSSSELGTSLISLARDCVGWFTRGARQRREARLLNDMAGLPLEAIGLLKEFAVNETHTLELDPWDRHVELLQQCGYLIPGPRTSSPVRRFFRVRREVWIVLQQLHEGSL